MTLDNNIEIICLRQVSKSKLLIDLSTETHGDCRICTPDDKNKLCSGYYPIRLYHIEVKNDYKPKTKF